MPEGKSIMKKKLTSSLLFYDLITLLLIFISVFIIFESIIKKIFVSYSTDRFTVNRDILEFDLSNGIKSLEEKEGLSYKDFSAECINYAKLSYLKKAKFDNSAMIMILPDGSIIGGFKNNLNPATIDLSLNYEKLNDIIKSGAGEEKLQKITINNNKFIGSFTLSATGLRKDFDRSNTEIVYPIIILADRESDFFYLVDLTRFFFLFWLTIIMLTTGTFKLKQTALAAREIKAISKMLKDESENIRAHGMIGTALKEIESDFIEVKDLNESSINLNGALSDLKDVVAGVTNEEFFIGTITKNKSITEQHEIYCTVMFLDIKGFTGITEKHKEHSMKIGIHIFSAVGVILKKYGGEIRKLLGDAALITFKKRTETDLTALCGIKSAVEILLNVPKINHELNSIYNPQNNPDLKIDFNFRIGMDSGVINEGLYGTPSNFEYGIIGDAVNTASRFEALNKQYSSNILLTENTYTMLNKEGGLESAKFDFYQIDEARTKGKMESSKIFTVTEKTETKIKLLGGKKEYPDICLKKFSELLLRFKNSITLWKSDESAGKGQKEWIEIIKDFSALHTEHGFDPVNQFIKLMLSPVEYKNYENNHTEWLKKSDYELNPPSADWINNKFLARELDK